MHRDLPPTRMWSYGGSMPGPTIETRSGRGLLDRMAKRAADPAFPADRSHASAARARSGPTCARSCTSTARRLPPESDGYPEDWYTPGNSAVYHYPNHQDAATLWYHDHAMGIERLNQYAGLFGVFLIRDEVEDALRLPGGPYEIPLVLCDRLFDARTASSSTRPRAFRDAPWVSEVNGDALLVNGKLFPVPRGRAASIPVSRRQRVELALLLSVARAAGMRFHQIGTDQGLLPAPVALTSADARSGRAGGPHRRFQRRRRREDRPLEPGVRADAIPRRSARPGAGSRSRHCRRSCARCGRSPSRSAVKTRTLTLNEYEDPEDARGCSCCSTRRAGVSR